MAWQRPQRSQKDEANLIDLKELEILFTDGYLRGAVNIAGLRVK